MVYVALLRGVNVGGTRKVSMGHLVELFQSLGFTSVKTFINSGNIIFASSTTNTIQLAQKIEKIIEKEASVTTQVLVKSLSDMQKVVAALPDSWLNNSDMRCDVLFLFPDVDNKKVLEHLPDINPDHEDCTYIRGAVLWRVDRAYVLRSKMVKVVSLPIYKQITIRNCNSTRKILTLMKETHDI